MRRSDKKFINILLLSVFIHLIFFFLHSLVGFQELKSPTAKQTQVVVKLKPKEPLKPQPQPESKEQSKPKEEPEKEQKPKPKIEEIPDLPSSYKSGDESQSLADISEKIDEGKAAKITGERAKVLKQKSFKAKKTVKEAGAVGTTALTDGFEVTESEDVVTDEELDGGLYDLGEAYDEEENESLGDEEEGVVSDKTVEFAEDLDELTFNEVGNTVLLSDTQLSNSFVKDPLSEKRSSELKVINSYLKEIVTLFENNWVNPLTPSQQLAKTGVVARFTISSEGYITEPYVYLHSEFTELDDSVINTLNKLSTHKLNWHKSYIEKYKYINLTWSGGGHKYEIMPFEAN